MKKKNNTKKIILYLKNKSDPSSFYRLYQYFFNNKNIKLINCVTSKTYYNYYNNEKANKFLSKLIMIIESILIPTWIMIWDLLIYHSDIIIINRKIFPRKMPFYGYYLLKKYYSTRTVYWDFDDNIIQEGEITKKECALLEKYSSKIIITNDYLKQTLSKRCHHKIKFLSTTDRAFEHKIWDVLIDRRINSYHKNIILIWIGTKGNLIFLEKIVPSIKEASKQINEKTQKKVILKCICNKKLIEENKRKDTYFTIENIKWSRDTALEELKNAHIGLMPLIDNSFTRGKAGFKAVQYIGAGIPAIVSNIGYNCEIIDSWKEGVLINKISEWEEAIIKLATDKELWYQYSLSARQKWKIDFSSREHQKIWEEIITGE